MTFFTKLLRYLAFNHGKAISLYKKFCKPAGPEFAAFLKARKILHAIGDDCAVNLNANITDPKYVSLGNNVVLSDCHLIGHDGVIAMLNNAYDVKLDAVGKIAVGNNVFIGHGAIVLRGVSIGNNVVIAAASVVNKDIPDNVVVAGVPARQIGYTKDLMEKLKLETSSLPWCDLIQRRVGAYDPNLESTLQTLRVKHFFLDR